MAEQQHLASVPSRAFDYVLRSFELPIDEALFRRTVETCRILIGVGMLHRYADIGGFLVMAPHAGVAERDVLVAMAVSTAVAFGFLTPLALAGLLYFTLYTPFGFTLAHQVVTLVAWSLLFSGAGQRASIDAWLLKLPNLAGLFRSLYVLAVPFSTRAFGVIRMIMLWLFWSISFGAMAFHFKDELWIRGNVLQLLLVTPYMSDVAESLASFRDAAPGLYGFLCQAGLFVQAVFELLLWPLCLFRWGRIFVAAQWLGFIVIRVLTMNLGYLCYDELVLWLFLFTLHPWVVARHRVSMAAAGETRAGSVPRSFSTVALAAFVALGIIVSIHFNATNFARINLPDSALARVRPKRTLYRLYGQWPVDVFNKADMSLGAAHLVLIELDDGGDILRVVPFLDDDGGRLSYLRNDFMYYGVSLPWQRFTRERQLDRAPALAKRVALLDADLTPGNAERHYAALMFTRRIEPFSNYQKWSESTFRGGFRFTIAAAEAKSRRAPTFPSYDLPPGHIGQRHRTSRTLSTVRELWDQGVLESLQVPQQASNGERP